jgi:catechol 2,3-dioxygenase-like lactoylglutathione lyase family enzyme
MADLKLELVLLPVSDVDRAKAFYTEQLGFDLDVDHQPNDEFRVVQVTPPGSACSVTFGVGITDAQPGSYRGTHLGEVEGNPLIVVLRHHHFVIREAACEFSRDQQTSFGFKIDVILILAELYFAIEPAGKLNKFEERFFRYKRVELSFAVVDSLFDICQPVAVGRYHSCDTVADHELRARQRKAALLIRDRECRVVDEVIEDLARKLRRGRLEYRQLGILLAVYAGETEARSAGLHLHPFVFEFLEMNITAVQCADDVEKLAGLDAH